MLTKSHYSAIHCRQGKTTFYVLALPARLLTEISYAAVRGVDAEEGATQRILNRRRIASIKKFALEVGHFPNAIILNWLTNDLEFSSGQLAFADTKNKQAQIIDGQHRLAGIEDAIRERSSIGDIDVPVVIYSELTTRECADIFLSINTEQKPVPRSLVVDLYGVASDAIADSESVRALDIARALQDDPDSPYYGEIKFPGSPTRRGGIALSTVVAGIKPIVEHKGTFYQIGLTELERQQQVIFNLFTALQRKYGATWFEKSNVFMYAAGFVGAIDFLQLKLVDYCQSLGSFREHIIENAIDFEETGLILQSEITGMSGKLASNTVYERLVDSFVLSNRATKQLEV